MSWNNYIIKIASVVMLSTQVFGEQQYIVKLKDKISQAEFAELKLMNNGIFQIIDINNNLNLLKISTDKISKLEIQNYFEAEYVVKNKLMYALKDISDPMGDQQWALEIIHAANAWDVSLGSQEIIVAVIDTGINYDHEDLLENMWVNAEEIPNNKIDDDKNGFIDDINGWDFHADDNDPNDETSSRNPGHGTHCAGIIGARCSNDLGICGISPEVQLMALRFLGKDGSGDLFASTKAIEYAVNHGADIISASWGARISEQDAQPLIEAIEAAEEAGVIFVAAAANDGKSNDRVSVYPANIQSEHSISVAASDSKDNKPNWSNFGRKVDIAAPGADILSTIPDGYSKMSGTSMATPLVAGLVALMKSVDPALTGAQARSILQASGVEVDIETASNKRIDAEQALNWVKEQKLTLVPAALTLSPEEEYDFSAWGGDGSYKFESLNPEIASISADGRLEALIEGDVVVQVKDGQNNIAQSVSIKILTPKESEAEPCPLDDPGLCELFCGIDPSFPWCP